MLFGTIFFVINKPSLAHYLEYNCKMPIKTVKIWFILVRTYTVKF